ncbi:hypothetical protein D3C71_1651420 [compost metagenome]
MPAVGQQAVGNIQRRGGTPAQQLAQGELRRRRPVMIEQRLRQRGISLALAQHQRQGPCRVTQLATNAQQVARASAVTAQCLPRRNPAEHGHGDTQGATGGVATDQAQLAVAGHAVEAAGIGLQPVGADLG